MFSDGFRVHRNGLLGDNGLMTFPAIYRQYRLERELQSQQWKINSEDLISANFHSSQLSLATVVSREHSLGDFW